MNEAFTKYRIRNKYGRDVTTGDVKELFGMASRNQAWPAAGMPGRTIQGIFCWVYPLNKSQGFKLRAYCSCGFCGKAVPIGRLYQHLKMHENNETHCIRAEKEA